MLTIDKKSTQETTVLKMTGKLDTQSAPQLEKEILGLDEACRELILDMTDLLYLSSAGLRVVLAAQKIMNKKGSMKLIGVNDTIMEIFDITGFIGILTIE